MNHSPLKTYYMYGKHATLAATQNPTRQIIEIFCTDKNYKDYANNLTNIKPKIVDNAFINNILGKDVPHQGVIIKVKPIIHQDIENFLQNGNLERIAILDQITDPQNIGAIIRSAAAFNINKLVVTKDNCPSENASIAKAAAGTLELVDILQVTNFRNLIDRLKKNGYWIAGLDSQGNSRFNDIKSIANLVIIIGSEQSGMRVQTKKYCDFLLSIPINQNVESLNAATAASIAFYSSQK